MKWMYPEKSRWSSALALLVLVGGINYAVLAWRMTEKREAGKEQAKEPQDLLAELGEGARPLRVLLYVAIALTADGGGPASARPKSCLDVRDSPLTKIRTRHCSVSRSSRFHWRIRRRRRS